MVDLILYVFEWYESLDGEFWIRRPELSGNFNPYVRGEPEISRLFTQAAEHWRVDVTPVEFPAGKIRGTLLLKSVVVGDTVTDTVIILPNLDGQEGSTAINISDLKALLSLWGIENQDLPEGTQDVFFEPGQDSETDKIAFRHLLDLVNFWYVDTADQ